jgi:hypothetical protein
MAHIHIFLEERFVSDAYSAPILVMLSLVLLELTEWLPSSVIVELSLQSCRYDAPKFC